MEFLDKYKKASRDDEGEGSSAKRRNIMEDDVDEAGDYEQGEDDYDNGEADEEEGGRFYGGGLTDEQRRMLELVDEIDAEEVYIYAYFSARSV